MILLFSVQYMIFILIFYIYRHKNNTFQQNCKNSNIFMFVINHSYVFML